MKKVPSPVPLPQKLRLVGRLRGRSPICWKKEKSFFQKLFRVLSVLFNGALLGIGFQIFIFPEARKAPGISPGAFLVS